MSLLGLMFLLFLGLKLAGFIAWSWWWVTAPLWGIWALIGLIGGLAVLINVATTLLDKPSKQAVHG